MLEQIQHLDNRLLVKPLFQYLEVCQKAGVLFVAKRRLPQRMQRIPQERTQEDCLVPVYKLQLRSDHDLNALFLGQHYRAESNQCHTYIWLDLVVGNFVRQAQLADLQDMQILESPILENKFG